MITGLEQFSVDDAREFLSDEHREGFTRFLKLCHERGIDTRRVRRAQARMVLDRLPQSRRHESRLLPRLAAGENVPGIAPAYLSNEALDARIDSLYRALREIGYQPSAGARDRERRSTLERLRAAQREQDDRAEALFQTNDYLKPGALDKALARARALLGEHDDPASRDGASNNPHR